MLSCAPVTVIINAVTIYIFWREKRMKTISDVLLWFLAITDIFGGFVAMPFFAAESILRAIDTQSPCSIFLTRKLVGLFSGDITLATSILIVLDRYCSIFQPYRYDVSKSQTGLVALVVVLLWCVCFAINSLSIITPNYVLAIVFVAFANITFVSLSIWAHSRILIQAKRIQREIAIECGHLERKYCKIRNWQRIKGARITAVMFSGIILCYAPQTITGFLMVRLDYSRSSLIAFYWTTGLILLNSIVNPILYIWQMKWFQNALWKITSKTELSVTNNSTATEWMRWFLLFL